MKILHKLTYLFLILFSSTTFALSSSINQIVVGSALSFKKPVLLTNQDGGTLWSLQPVSLFPEMGNSPSLESVTCSGTTCIAVGNFVDATTTIKGMDDERVPLILQSTDSGRHWTYIKITSSATFLKSVSCQSNGFCIAVGSGSSFFSYYPVIHMSTDHGSTWTSVANVPGNHHSGANSSSCNSQACVAVGEYEYADRGSEESKPLIMTTRDQGKQWTLVSKINNFPQDSRKALINTVKCNEKSCLALGEYYVKDRTGALPLVLMSNADGTQWKFMNVLDEHHSTSIKLIDGLCEGNRCVIAGNSNDHAIYIYSSNNGSSWQISDRINNLPDNGSSSLNSLSCDNMHCIAAGYYGSNGYSYPMIINSEDGGKSWEFNNSFVDLATNDGGNIVNVHCNELHCTALSLSYAARLSAYIYYSNDKGLTWFNSNPLADLPKDYVVLLSQASSTISA